MTDLLPSALDQAGSSAAPSLVRLVTVSEAARRIGFPVGRILQQVHLGNVPAFSVAGSLIVLRAEDLDLARQQIVVSLRRGPRPRKREAGPAHRAERDDARESGVDGS